MNRVGPALQLQQKQDVSMTAELRQAIEMLQLSAPELADMVARELGENPCLEYEEGLTDERVSGLADKETGDTVDWDNAWDQWAIRDEGADGPAGEGFSYASRGTGDDESGGWEASASREVTLQEHLLRQYFHIVSDPKLRVVGQFLIDAIDDAGYLRADLHEVAARLKTTDEVVDDARAIIQTLDPAGVGARSLSECLRLQMHALGQLDAVAEVCLERLDLVASADWEKLAALVNKGAKGGQGWSGCDAEEVQLAVEAIRACNPKPAAGFGTSRIDGVVVDVVVSRNQEPGAGNQESWAVELNGAAFPRLLAFPPSGGLTGRDGVRGRDEARKYLNERYGRAKWLISALEQRARTTLAVARAIVKAQSQFFEAGVEFLLPLTLREVADAIGVHESTVSRVVSGKYMQTPWGVVAFKIFFSSGVASSGGQVGVAATSVQALIAKLVKAENPQKPLSDEQIVTRLKDEGVEVARRTVAKYRGILGIPGTAERRVR